MSADDFTERAAYADVNKVTDLVSVVVWVSPAWMYLERVPQDYLEPKAQLSAIHFATLDVTTNFNSWERGRIFDANRELRWERIGGDFHVVYCGIAPPASMTELDLENSTVRETHYYLWGQQVRADDRERVGLLPDQSAFIELRIPHVLHYPLPPSARRAQVRVRELLGVDGSLRYVRWAGLREA